MSRLSRIAVLLAVSSWVLPAQGSSPLLSQYLVDEWTIVRGFPEESVLSMYRQPNGFLWLGTANGLLRFDGESFVPFYPHALKRNIRAVSMNARGQVLCAVERVGVFRVDGRELTLVWPYNIGGAPQPRFVRSFDGRLLLLSGQEIFEEARGGSFRLWMRLPEPGTTLVEAAPGRLVATGESGQVFLLQASGPIAVGHVSAKPLSAGSDREGGAWLGTTDALWHIRFPPSMGRAVPDLTRVVPSPYPLAVMTWVAGDGLWFGTPGGLYRLSGDRLEPSSTGLRQLPSNVGSVESDAEGSLWAAYGNGGLFRVWRPKFPNWGLSDGVPGLTVHAVLHDGEGGAWVGGSEGLAHIRPDGEIRLLHRTTSADSFHFLCRVGDGTLWALSSRALHKVDIRTGNVAPVPLPVQDATWNVLFQASSGEVWIGSAEGDFYRCRPGEPWSRLPIAGVPPLGVLSMLAETADGQIWLSVRNRGLYKLAGGKAVPVAAKQPESLWVHTLYGDRDGTLWLGLDGGGLGRVAGDRIQMAEVDPQWHLNSVFFLAEDLSGHLWAGLRNGLLRVDRTALNAYLDGRRTDIPMRRFDVGGALAGGNFGTALQRSHPTPASVLWLPHVRGVTKVDTGQLPETLPPPPVVIEKVVVDGVSTAFRSRTLTIAPGAQRVEIYFTAPLLSEPRRRTYRYQLVGLQENPIGPLHQNVATFTRVEPGNYEFRVWASGGDGLWGDQPAVLRMTFQPRFYQTWPFLVSCGLALLGSIYGAGALRMRRHRRVTARLEAMVAARTSELEKAREAAEAATRVKAEFLATMSHEIRTPLHGVMGTLELIGKSENEHEREEYVTTALQSGESLLQLLNGVLDLSRLEAGHSVVSASTFDLAGLVLQVVQAFRPAASLKGIELRVDVSPGVPPVMTGDPARLRQILNNLVGNAVKFTDRGSVTVSASSSRINEREHRVCIVIRDTGVGIDPARVKELFQPFSQLDTSSGRRFGGTGLGLAISHRLAEAMAGTLSVESELGKGAAFTLSLVLEEGEPVASAEHASEPALAHLEGRILLVEDNETNQFVAKRLLEKLGCSVDIADNGAEGVRRAMLRHYDVILMDFHMPEMIGPEAAKLIRGSRNPNAITPIVALTASSATGERELCAAAGMTAFLVKPYGAHELLEILTPLLAQPVAAPDVHGTEKPPVSPV